MSKQLKLFNAGYRSRVVEGDGKKVIEVLYHSSLDDYSEALAWARAHFKLKPGEGVLIALPST